MKQSKDNLSESSANNSASTADAGHGPVAAQVNLSLSGKSRRLVAVFKSRSKDEMYLFVDKQAGLKPVPENLLALFAAPELVFELMLTPDKKLARSDAREILQSIRDNGFYLQMPPPPEALTIVARAREAMPAKARTDRMKSKL